MDRNRKILLSILALLILSLVIAIIDITLRMQDKETDKSTFIPMKTGPGVGIVRIEGPIKMNSKPGPWGISFGSDAVLARLEKLRKNKNVKAIVIRINSPGGTVAATQEIYQKIWQLRKKNIPIIASLGDIAASGGYYIASACNKIMANHGTITGSIGVIAYSPNVKKLFDKLGIKMNIIKSGKYKDILSMHRDITEEEKNLLQLMIDSSYKKFIKDVALGRNQNQSEIIPFADGRIMNGETALNNKLIDMLGTFSDAIEKAREMAKLGENSVIYDENESSLGQFLMSLENMFKGAGSLSNRWDFNSKYMLEYRYMQ